MRAGLRAAVAVTIILGVVALVGKPALAAFGISMPALQLVAACVVGAAVALVLTTPPRLGVMIGYRGQRILLRFMGLILAAVGAEVLLAGIYTFAPRS